MNGKTPVGLARVTRVETAAERTGGTVGEDPYGFDDRLEADNLGSAASAIRWL
ncbi:hypothetical protein [Streptomyces sp. NPDC088915]|uniref:hypothetical protein n=1 Tax=Streptomyces sp. NPDC088915 TaxID=3365912 RepID=UPI00382F6EA1